MGDISRHRDIYLNTREAIPTSLLSACKLTKADLTYLELGNYFTDVSQFRDPVTYIFAKRRIWHDKILPKTSDKVSLLRGLAVLAGVASIGASEILKEQLSGTPSDIAKYGGPGLAAAAAALAVLPTDTYADLGGADNWIDQMFGIPIEKIGKPTSDQKEIEKRDKKHYGLIGQFFRYFIEGITHLLFANDIRNRVPGAWGQLDRITEKSVTAMFEKFFTQYFPHEHTDQPPYVWDASKRPSHPMYQPSGKMGVMNAVDEHYVQYLSEGLTDLEHEWRGIKAEDAVARHKWLVRMGKLLHGIEDWYFHSNVVELLRIRGHRPSQAAGEKDEDFLQRFVNETAKNDPEFTSAKGPEHVRLKRRLYRRLRFPAYEQSKKNSGGILSIKKMSTLSLHHAYPAFPSQQDTAHTLLHALENLEDKLHPSGSGITFSKVLAAFSWAPCVLRKLFAAKDGEARKLLREKARARGVSDADLQRDPLALLIALPEDKREAVLIDVLREWIPLVVTLLHESERQRLVANVDPLQWPVKGGATAQPRSGVPKDFEMEEQRKRHVRALERKKNEDEFTENNYERMARYLVECGFLNASGQAAIKRAFEIDQESEGLPTDAPGCGNFLMMFALELQEALDIGEKAAAALNKDPASIFSQVSDNCAFNENIGSHSLMSKDTLASPPFFNDAKVLASVASMSVFQIMLEEVSTPASDTGLNWKEILHYFIRFPPTANGWERHAIAVFNNSKSEPKQIPRFADLPKLAELKSARLPMSVVERLRKRTNDNELKKDSLLKALYTRLEIQLSRYRYP